MSKTDHLRTGIISSLVLLAALVGAYFYGEWMAQHGLSTTMEASIKKDQVVSAMLAGVHQSAEAEKSSVMAQTDEESESFAEESRAATLAVENHRLELVRLIEGTANGTEEADLLDEFNHAWNRYQELNKEILTLAVENTNLKALRLSFGPAHDAIERFERSLDALEKYSQSSVAAAEIEEEASDALIAALKIQLLQHRHIVEPRDEVMDAIEVEMKALDEQVRERLSNLTPLATADGQPFVRQAGNAFDDFSKVHRQILDLSRRNSNVQSFAVSLGTKRLATARCAEILESLQKSIRAAEVTPTR